MPPASPLQPIANGFFEARGSGHSKGMAGERALSLEPVTRTASPGPEELSHATESPVHNEGGHDSIAVAPVYNHSRVGDVLARGCTYDREISQCIFIKCNGV